MRALVRPNVSLPTLADVRSRYAPGKPTNEGGPPEGLWNKPDVRGAVYAIGGRVCAYCQREASDTRGDIEHFRPKSLYRWLMYEFNNYLLGCRVCNSTRKGDAFPMAPRAKPITFTPRMLQDRAFLFRALAREKRLLVDPATDPVDDWVTVDFSDPLCEVRLSDKANRDTQARERLKTTIEFFGLNTIPELIWDRVERINTALGTLKAYKAGDASARTELLKMANRYQPHGWAVRQTLAALAPDLVLPTAAEDLENFVAKTMHHLRLVLMIQSRSGSSEDSELVEARTQENCWTLAVIWKDPPTTSADQIRQWLNAGGVLPAVQPFYDKLA